MSEIVIRHIEASDAEALRDIMSHPGVYHDTLQIPHPSMAMWHERVAVKPGRRHLVACLDGRVVGHMALDIMENPRRSHLWHRRGGRYARARRRKQADDRDDQPVRQLAAR